MSRVEDHIGRLHHLYPKLIDLSLERLTSLLAKLGNPERKLPPVIHVAGTNGKGSVCAFARAIAEAAGLRVHVYTSPHLVSFNERIRLAGVLATDAALESAFAEMEAANGGAPITVFEAITAVGFILFARVPADLCILEVGLGGKFDATNVLPNPAACAITSISMDHMDFLGDDIESIAGEKAGIIKPGVPVVTGRQTPAVMRVLETFAATQNAPLSIRDRDWHIEPTESGLRFSDATRNLPLPQPSLPGAHQIENAGIAIQTLKAAGCHWPDA
ncbi:MAG TPA: Mur ligase family protein, partial [Acetobacteraceae bacterium]|nr:Mur ligase family protein [Acetobacteraceae bacterium]